MRDVSEMKIVCTTKSWVDFVNDSPIMHVINQGMNIEYIDFQEIKEHEQRLRNIVIHGRSRQRCGSSLNQVVKLLNNLVVWLG